MNILLSLMLFLIAVVGTAVVFIRDTSRQVLVLSFYGFILAVLFILFQAPDVAMAQGIISGVILPLLILLAIAKTGDFNND